MYKPKYSNEEYLNSDPFGGDMDVDIRHQKVKLINIRKTQRCSGNYECGSDHIIKAGEQVYRETGLLYDGWYTCYTCLKCLDKMIDIHNN